MIRKATLADVTQMLVMGERFYAQTGYEQLGLPFCRDRLQQVFETLIPSNDALVLVAERDNALVGMLGAVASLPITSDRQIAVELFWWVEPHVRGGPTGLRMKQQLEDWAQERNAAVVMASMTAISDSPAEQIYLRRGYVNTEKSWIRRA